MTYQLGMEIATKLYFIWVSRALTYMIMFRRNRVCCPYYVRKWPYVTKTTMFSPLWSMQEKAVIGTFVGVMSTSFGRMCDKLSSISVRLLQNNVPELRYYVDNSPLHSYDHYVWKGWVLILLFMSEGGREFKIGVWIEHIYLDGQFNSQKMVF